MRVSLTMKRHGRFNGVWVGDTVKTDLVGDVCDLIGVVYGLLLDFQRMDTGVSALWLVVDSLCKVALEDLHDAVSIGMVVDQGALGGVPDDENQVRLAVHFVDDVPRVAPALICACVSFPVLRVRSVFGHEGFDVIGVDVGRVDARGWT